MTLHVNPGAKVSFTSRGGPVVFGYRGTLRQFLLVAFAAVTVVAVACGGSDGDESNAGSSPEQDPTVNTGDTVILVPTGGASDFEVATPRDGVFDLERLEGQPVLLNFWFPSCPPCRAELPDLQAAYEKHGDEIQFLGVQLLGLDSAEEADEFLLDLGVMYPSGPDAESKMVRKFKVVGFPTTIFINSDHNIVKKHTGILSADNIESFINATVASGSRLDVSGS